MLFSLHDLSHYINNKSPVPFQGKLQGLEKMMEWKTFFLLQYPDTMTATGTEAALLEITEVLWWGNNGEVFGTTNQTYAIKQYRNTNQWAKAIQAYNILKAIGTHTWEFCYYSEENCILIIPRMPGMQLTVNSSSYTKLLFHYFGDHHLPPITNLDDIIRQIYNDMKLCSNNSEEYGADALLFSIDPNNGQRHYTLGDLELIEIDSSSSNIYSTNRSNSIISLLKHIILVYHAHPDFQDIINTTINWLKQGILDDSEINEEMKSNYLAIIENEYANNIHRKG